MACAGVAGLSVLCGITHVVVSRTQNVGNIVVNRLESGIGDLPFVIVFRLGDVSDMSHHDDIQLLLILFNPLGLLEEAGPLITDLRPVLLCRFMPDVSVTLSVRQNDQGKTLRILLGFLVGVTQTRDRCY